MLDSTAPAPGGRRVRQRVLLTGGTGFLGRQIAGQLLQVGHQVTILTHSEGNSGDYAASGASFVAGDVCDANSLEAAVREIDVVCHAAGIPRSNVSNQCIATAMRRVNAEGTRNVCRAAARAGVGRVVAISSITVYGSNRDKLLTEGDDCRPEDGYAASKLQAEEFASCVAAEYGLAVTVLRLGPLYGPGHAGNVRRLLAAIERRRFYPVGRGLNRKSLLHVEDAARACRLAVESEPRGVEPFSLYNVAGPPVAVRDIVARACDAMRRPPYRGYFPALPFRLLFRAGLGPRAIGRWVADEAIDSSRFKRAFGWRPEIDLTSGFRIEASTLHRRHGEIVWVQEARR